MLNLSKKLRITSKLIRVHICDEKIAEVKEEGTRFYMAGQMLIPRDLGFS